jgi:DNA-binding HxlR family transcriptional regulator
MSRTDTSAWPCTIARTADLLGDDWNLLIVRQACLGSRRFEEFRTALGIGRNVLTNHLNQLVAEGVLSREPYQERPVRHHYRLTEKGRDVFPILAAMAAFGEKWLSGPDGPPIVLSHTACGHDMRVEVVCDHCHKPLRMRETRVRPGPGYQSAGVDR